MFGFFLFLFILFSGFFWVYFDDVIGERVSEYLV